QATNDLTLEGGSGSIELLNELARVDAMLTKCRPDGRCRRSRSTWSLNLELYGNFLLGHLRSLNDLYGNLFSPAATRLSGTVAAPSERIRGLYGIIFWRMTLPARSKPA